MRTTGVLLAAILVSLVAVAGRLSGQPTPAPFPGVLDEHPAIAYASATVRDPVSVLNQALIDGSATLTYEAGQGYLQSVLDALRVPRESQMLVFSKTGIQAGITSPRNPRALLFNDTVVIGYIRGAPYLELAAHDPEQGVIFYTLPQRPQARATFTRQVACLTCHVSFGSMDVPGLLSRSIVTAPDGQLLPQLGNVLVDQRTPFEERWGGWFVTGTHGSMRHMGNATATNMEAPQAAIGFGTLNVRSLEGKTDLNGYPSTHSDIVALTVFQHEVRMVNLLTRVNWEARVNGSTSGRRDGPSLDELVVELVDYALFVDEAPLTAKLEGFSGFAKAFAAAGPRDARGRSLRDLDLTTRLMRHPCSYMIYVDAFDHLPATAKDAVYRRMWDVLSGNVAGPRYAKLSTADRRAIVEILRETKPGLPSYFVPLR